MTVTDHPLRLDIAGELHARPFPPVEGPITAVYLALMPGNGAAASRDRTKDMDGLFQLLDHYGAPKPSPDATHFFGTVGKGKLKWECHTEFVTYTAYLPKNGTTAFDPGYFDFFPPDWLAGVQGDRLTSAIVAVEDEKEPTEINRLTQEWFVSESLAIARVLDEEATVAGDFRIDPAGHMRFVLFKSAQTGPRRIGRIIQRITEIETYKAVAMLGFKETEHLNGKLARLESELTDAVTSMRREGQAETALDNLLTIAAELEETATHSSFRFAATAAYARLVGERISVLRETRFNGRQTFHEFMMRRFEPAIRTVTAREARLSALSGRAARAAELLRTKVDVARSAQNQELLESMNHRADLQLKLQRTVEGLSVVAISYYAVNLAAYFLTPLLPLSKSTIAGALVIPVLIIALLGARRIHKKF